MTFCKPNEIKSKHFLKKFHKFTNNKFRIVITQKLEICDPALKDKKTIVNHVLSTKRIVLVVHVTLVKPIVTQKPDGINIIIQLKVPNHQKTFEAT